MGRALTVAVEVPRHLISEVLAGRCVAFVGAGFSSNMPSWGPLLECLVAELSGPVKQQVGELIKGGNAFDFEAAGQLIRDEFREQHGEQGEARFEAQLAAILEEGLASESAAMKNRRRWLSQIPFAAILTTNYDPNFVGQSPKSAYAAVLRHHLGWWARDRILAARLESKPLAVKLHGDANRSPADNPVVLAKKDYRRLLYEDARYGNFLRAIFATKTVLFLGVSFTDAYLNELRSEILSLVGPRLGEHPSIGYAVLADRSPEVRAYFASHEGVDVLHYEAGQGDAHDGFDRWLEAIHGQTAPVHRLRGLLAGERIVWVDANPDNNTYGALRLFTDAEASILTIKSPADLDEAAHGDAKLLITSFGYEPGGTAAAVRVLKRINQWSHRPPVIVFADAAHASENRRLALRHGAFDFASNWSELLRLIEQLFGRDLG